MSTALSVRNLHQAVPIRGGIACGITAINHIGIVRGHGSVISRRFTHQTVVLIGRSERIQ